MSNIMPADTYDVINRTVLTDNDRKILTMLYQPIIGAYAVNLFLTLWMDLDKNEFMSQEENHHHLLSSTGLSLNEIVVSREKLEAVGLLKTFYKENEEENHYIYELYSPLSAHEFLTHPVLNIVLYNSVGKKEYERIVNYFKVPKINLNDYKDITKSFDEVYNSEPLSSYENIIENIKANNKIGINIKERIDFDSLISTLPKETINIKTFNPENKKLINDLAFIYNYNEDEMKNIILSSLNERMMIDKTVLRKNARNNYQYQNSGKLPSLIYRNQPEYLRSPIGKDTKRARLIYTFETISPYNYLKSKNGGKEPVDRDLKIIESLSIDLGLQPAVINVLVDYCLRMKNNKLIKSYIEAIGSQWKRLNIETAEDAMNHALEEIKKMKKSYKNKKVEKELPKWMDENIQKEEISKDVEDEMKNLLKDFS